MELNIPEHLKEYLSNSYKEQLFDSYSGECTGWGYKIMKHCGDEIWKELSQLGSLECAYPNWFLILKKLTVDEAVEKYGQVTEVETGVRGGFKTATFGTCKFCSKDLDPRNIMDVNHLIKIV